MDLHDIETWADANLAQKNLDSSTLGIAGALLNLILGQVISFNRYISQHRFIANPSHRSRALHREIERLVLWKSRFTRPNRDLDTILLKSLELRHCVILSLHGLGSVLQRGIAHTPGAESDVPELKSRMKDLRGLLEQAAVILDISVSDEDASEGVGDESISATGVGRLVDDMSWYIDCLDDLSPALESPVEDVELADPVHQQLESFTVSSPEALTFCRHIRDRFKKLPKRLVERLGEANAVRAKLLKTVRDAHDDMERRENDLKPLPAPSESLFSASMPKPTETTSSSFKPDSIFDTNPHYELAEETSNDNASFATFASLSTTFSTASLGRPRVPPLPDAALQRESFSCSFCYRLLTGIYTRRAWKCVDPLTIALVYYSH